MVGITSPITSFAVFENNAFDTLTAPSTTIFCPLTNAESSDAKNRAAAAISAALSTAPFNTAASQVNFSTNSAVIIPNPQLNGVATPNGETQLTLTPFSPSSPAAAFTNPNTPCFAIVYATGANPPTAAATLAVQIIDPLIPAATIARPACLIAAAIPRT
ncbi:hypothetical protein IEQ34_008721 [Dendrobium chrysotoxum]|uniref:Uncharacterized protein n=1 Tax=Dendrobium chrysotoxum TaxID=161865 RepID=A0AAV7GWP0_DENCH|nr:hypothetical protein IEQ34_008721 [Dendrobium chrysotoxum]